MIKRFFLLLPLAFSGCAPDGPYNHWTCRQDSGFLAAPAGLCDIKLEALSDRQPVYLEKQEVRLYSEVRVKARVSSFEGRIRLSVLTPQGKEDSLVVEPGQTSVLETRIKVQGLERNLAALDFARLDPGPRVARGRALVLYRMGKGDFPPFPNLEP